MKKENNTFGKIISVFTFIIFVIICSNEFSKNIDDPSERFNEENNIINEENNIIEENNTNIKESDENKYLETNENLEIYFF